MVDRLGRRLLAPAQTEKESERVVRVPLRVWELDELRCFSDDLLDECLVGLVVSRNMAARLLEKVRGTKLEEPLVASLDGRGDIELSDREYQLIAKGRRITRGTLYVTFRDGQPRQVKSA